MQTNPDPKFQLIQIDMSLFHSKFTQIELSTTVPPILTKSTQIHVLWKCTWYPIKSFYTIDFPSNKNAQKCFQRKQNLEKTMMLQESFSLYSPLIVLMTSLWSQEKNEWLWKEYEMVDKIWILIIVLTPSFLLGKK